MVDARSSGTLVKMEQQCLEDSLRWFPVADASTHNAAVDIKHHILALCGEVGEVANLAKKADRGSIDPYSALFKHDLAMELADVLTYLLNIAGLLGIDLEATYYVKRDFNNERFTRVVVSQSENTSPQ